MEAFVIALLILIGLALLYPLVRRRYRHGTLEARSQTWTLTGANAGTHSLLGTGFSGMSQLTDLSGGTLVATGQTWTLTAANAGTHSQLGTGFSGMTRLTDLGQT